MLKPLFSLIYIAFLFSNLTAQTEVFIGSIPSNAEISFFNKVAASDEHYYFAAWNFEGIDRTVSVFKTTQDFVLVESIENLKIRDTEVAHTTYLAVADDKLMMISSARINNEERLYSHSLDLNLDNNTIIDSLEYRVGEEFIAHQYKVLDNGNIYAFGNISQNNTRNVVSANYFEFTDEGNIIKFENVDIPTLLITAFDYNPNLNRYIVRDFTNTYLLDSLFSVVFNLNLNTTSGSTIAQIFAGHCNFASDSLIQSIGSNPDADNFTNFVAELRLTEDSLFYASAIPLHPAGLNNERAFLVHVSKDPSGNYFSSYHEPFISLDGEVLPNKIFISKYDENFEELFFLELDGPDEYVISESILDKDNNLIIVGAVTLSESPNAAQNFYIKVSENGEVLTSTLQPVVSNDLTLFPNPCSDFIKVSGFDNFADGRYRIYSLDGILLSNGSLLNNEIPTANLPIGMYLLNVLNEDGIYKSKFVKR